MHVFCVSTDKFVSTAGVLTARTTTSSIHDGGKDALISDVDLFDVIGDCMDGQDEVQELARCLTEMEAELKSVVDDASFLHFPSKGRQN